LSPFPGVATPARFLAEPKGTSPSPISTPLEVTSGADRSASMKLSFLGRSGPIADPVGNETPETLGTGLDANAAAPQTADAIAEGRYLPQSSQVTLERYPSKRPSVRPATRSKCRALRPGATRYRQSRWPCPALAGHPAGPHLKRVRVGRAPRIDIETWDTVSQPLTRLVRHDDQSDSSPIRGSQSRRRSLQSFDVFVERTRRPKRGRAPPPTPNSCRYHGRSA
jgi:hypothetical protein